MHTVSRRRFLQISSATVGLAATGAAAGHLAGQAAAAGETERGVRKVPTFCDICFWKCGAIAHVKDGKLWKIEGNPDDPLGRGRLCPRGTGGVGAHFDPDRLRTPLVRRRKRGQEV
ncbi:MAG: nitrate reductase, partial [Acidobacteria bacterium]